MFTVWGRGVGEGRGGGEGVESGVRCYGWMNSWRLATLDQTG